MSEESHGLFHFGHKDDQPAETPKEGAPPAEEHHGLFHFGSHEEPPPPPPPEKHGLFHFGSHEEPPPPPPPTGLMGRLFHRAPVSPEPASPQRAQLFRHHSFRSALYILGLLLLLAGIVPGVVPSGYGLYALVIGAALLLGGVLLTGDWHPLSGMLGLRKVRVPTSASGVATVVAEHEAKSVIDKVTKEDDEEPKASAAQRLAPWHWPWSERAREAAQERKAEEAKKFTHVGIFNKVLMGIMVAVMGFGANKIISRLHPPANLSSLPNYAHWIIVLVTIALILGIITTRIRTFRHHWLTPFGVIRRLLIFLIAIAVVGLTASLLTNDQTLGQGYGELIGGLVGILAILL